MKRSVKTALSLVLVLSMVSACAKGGTPSMSPETEASVSIETVKDTTDSNVEQAKQEIPLERGFMETPDLDEYSEEVVFPEGTEIISFSGKVNSRFISDNYSAYESDKYILLVDKNVELPGNYAIMLDQIVDAIEEVSGLSFKTERKNFTKNMVPTYSNEYPWKDVKSGDKYIIQLNNSNRNPNEYPGPIYGVGYMSIEDIGIYTFANAGEIYESDYVRMIDLLSRGILTKQYPDLSWDDRADEVIYYYVVEKLEEKYDDLKRVNNEMSFEAFSPDITAENIEDIWIKEFQNWSDWSQKNAVVELFIYYMMENYGTGFLPSLISDDYSDVDLTRQELAARIKNIYGDDIFAKYVSWVNSKMPDAPELITFNGDGSTSFYADKNYYTEGERCFIYIEQGLYIPDNYVATADKIVSLLEKKMWNKDDGIIYGASLESQSGPFYGISNDNKLPIVLKNDTDGMGYISAFWEPDVHIYDWGMMEEDFDKIEYETLAHECSHAVMYGKGDISKIGKIMSEGSADYYAEAVMNELGLYSYPYHDFYYQTPINADTAEALFLNDFSDVGHRDRGAEYSYGYYLSKYLDETFGSDYLTKVTKEILNSGIKADADYGDDADRNLRLEIFKSVFGDDVFAKFGTWYVNSKF